MGRDDSNCVMHNISLIHENSELIYILPRGYLANDAAIAIPQSELTPLFTATALKTSLGLKVRIEENHRPVVIL